MKALAGGAEQPHSFLMPAKFISLICQALLLTLVLYLRSNHSIIGDSQSVTALVGVTVCFLVFLAFEFADMILGISLLFNQINML